MNRAFTHSLIREIAFKDIPESPVYYNDNNYTSEKARLIIEEAERQTDLSTFVYFLNREHDALVPKSVKFKRKLYWTSVSVMSELYEGPIAPENLFPASFKVKVALLAPVTKSWQPFREKYLLSQYFPFGSYCALIKQRICYLEAALQWHHAQKNQETVNKIELLLEYESRRMIADGIMNTKFFENHFSEYNLKHQMLLEAMLNNALETQTAKLTDMLFPAGDNNVLFAHLKTNILNSFEKLAKWKTWKSTVGHVLQMPVSSKTHFDFVRSHRTNRYDFVAAATADTGCGYCSFNEKLFLQFFYNFTLPSLKPQDVFTSDLPSGPSFGVSVLDVNMALKKPTESAYKKVHILEMKQKLHYKQIKKKRQRYALQAVRNPNGAELFSRFLVAKLHTLVPKYLNITMTEPDSLTRLLKCEQHNDYEGHFSYDDPTFRAVVSNILAVDEMAHLCQQLKDNMLNSALQTPDPQLVESISELYQISNSFARPRYQSLFPWFKELSRHYYLMERESYLIGLVAYDKVARMPRRTAFEFMQLVRNNQLFPKLKPTSNQACKAHTLGEGDEKSAFDHAIYKLQSNIWQRTQNVTGLHFEYLCEVASISCVDKNVHENTRELLLKNDFVLSRLEKFKLLANANAILVPETPATDLPYLNTENTFPAPIKSPAPLTNDQTTRLDVEQSTLEDSSKDLSLHNRRQESAFAVMTPLKESLKRPFDFLDIDEFDNPPLPSDVEVWKTPLYDSYEFGDLEEPYSIPSPRRKGAFKSPKLQLQRADSVESLGSQLDLSYFSDKSSHKVIVKRSLGNLETSARPVREISGHFLMPVFFFVAIFVYFALKKIKP